MALGLSNWKLSNNLKASNTITHADLTSHYSLGLHLGEEMEEQHTPLRDDASFLLSVIVLFCVVLLLRIFTFGDQYEL